eukprot:Nk52_evm19s564 gene=Nk52_evmTU19s564
MDYYTTRVVVGVVVFFSVALIVGLIYGAIYRKNKRLRREREAAPSITEPIPPMNPPYAASEPQMYQPQYPMAPPPAVNPDMPPYQLSYNMAGVSQTMPPPMYCEKQLQPSNDNMV